MLDLETIRSLEMFEGLQDQDFGKIFRLGKQADYPAEAVIVREGAQGGMLHVILEGQVEVRKHASTGDQKPLAVLSQGAVFGEMSLFDGYPYSASVVAKLPTRTLSLFRNDFMSLADAEPKLAFKITVNLLNILSRKLRKTNENLITLALLRGTQA